MSPESSDQQESGDHQEHRVCLLTDVVGAVALKSKIGDELYAKLIKHHNALFRDRLSEHNGTEIDNPGDGFFATFDLPSDAVRHALHFQNDLIESDGPETLSVRIGVHSGQVVVVDGKPTGLPVDTAARVRDLAEGRQILLTRGVFDSARQFVGRAPEDPALEWRAHGLYEFQGLDEPSQVFEVGDPRAPLRPPTDSEKAKRMLAAGEEATLGWRPAPGLAIPGRKGWKLERRLGVGGFGEVWLAEQKHTHEQRAFKFCFRADRLRSLKRKLTLFLLIKKVLGERPDIVRLYDVQFDQAPFYLEMAYAAGGDLPAWAKGQGGLGGIDLNTRLEIVAQVAGALSAAHSVGVIHKDVKPSNVLIHEDKDGSIQARLNDFGIGQLLDRESLERAGVTASGFTEIVPMTELGSRTGTRLYMAPELLAGKPASASIQSDIYAVGVLLYQVVVADLNRPLAQGWEGEVKDGLLREDIAACVAGDPAARLSGADLLARSLRSLTERRRQREAERIRVAAEARRRRLLRLTGTLAVVLGLLAIVAGLGYQNVVRQRDLAELRRSSAELQEHSALAAQQEAEAGRDREAILRKTAERQSLELLDARQTNYRRLLSFSVEALRTKDHGSAVRFLSLCAPEMRGWEWLYQRQHLVYGIAVVTGFEGSVSKVSLVDQGRQLVALSAHEIRRWQLGHPRTSLLTETTAHLTSMTVLPGDTWMITGARTGEMRLWDAQTGELLLTDYRGHTSSIVFLAPLDNAGTIISADRTGQISTWNALSGERLKSFSLQPAMIDCAALHSSGALVCGTWNRETGGSTLMRVDLSTGRQTVLGTSEDRFYAVTCSSDGVLLAAGVGKGELQIWDVERAELQHSFKEHEDIITAIAFHPSEPKLATASLDGKLKVWDLTTRSDLGTVYETTGGISGVKYTRDGSQIVTAGSDRTIRLSNASPGPAQQLILFDDEVVSDAALSLDGRYFATVTFDKLDEEKETVPGRVELWDAATGQLLDTIATDVKKPRCLAISPNGMQVAWNNYYDLFARDLAPGLKTERLVTPNNLRSRIHAVDFSRDGRSIISIGPGNEMLRIWDARTREHEHVISRDSRGGHAAIIWSLAVSPDGRQFVTGGGDRTLMLRNIHDGSVLRRLAGHQGIVLTAAFDASGERVTSGGRDGSVNIWRVADGELLQSLSFQTAVSCVAFSPDGQRVISATGDGLLTISDVETGETIIEEQRPTPVVRIGFSADGHRLMIAEQKRIEILDFPSQK